MQPEPYEFEMVRVPHSLLIGRAREREIRLVSERMMRSGWQFLDRSDTDGIFGFGGCTVLHFRRRKPGFNQERQIDESQN